MSSPVILITGSTRGIGFAAAQQLIARGAHVIITSRNVDHAAAAAQQLGNPTGWLQLDLTDPASIEAATTTLEDRHGRLDVLVNNAAILLDDTTSLLELKPDTLAATLTTNLIGTLRVTQAMVPLLSRSNSPRIINLSSGAGQLSGPPQAWAPAYSISKTAVNMLTQQLAAALPGVIVNSMCPGWCRTAMGGNSAPRSAEQGADTVTWLALDAPSSLHGQFVKDRQVIPW